jgi:glycosyltransferase involved in cell wall biosynthesis
MSAVAAGSRLLVVGSGPALAEMQELAVQLGAQVGFLGYRTGEALHDAIRSAGAVVLPSEWYENAPMSVLEAYALGKPVIGARIGGFSELIRENETGLGFESASQAEPTAALRHISERSGAAIEGMGQSARYWVEQEFTATIYQARMIDMYRDLGVQC